MKFWIRYKYRGQLTDEEIEAGSTYELLTSIPSKAEVVAYNRMAEGY